MIAERVLVVTAHPDDAEFHFGATIARLVSDGAEVTYLVCTDGTQGSDDETLTDEQVAAIRTTEQREAAAVLGVRQVTFLGLPDGRLTPTLDLRRAIAAQVRKDRPSLVIAHYPHRVLDIPIEASHPDHVAAGETTLAAVYPDAGNRRAFPELLHDGLAPHRVDEVWIPGYRHPTHFVDATPFMDKKLEAVRSHRSQLPDGDPAWLLAWMHQMGKIAGHEYSEHFRRVTIA